MNSFHSQPAASSPPMESSNPSPLQAAAVTPTGGDAVSLGRLSTHLERLLLDPAFSNRFDTEIVLASSGGEPGAGAGAAATVVVGAHSCILAARSLFFQKYFSSIPAGDKARLNLADVVPGGRHIGRDALVAVLGYLYTGRLKVPPDQKCVDDTCKHGACRPAIDFVVECTYAASGFQIPELILIVQRRLSDDIVDIAVYEDIIPIIRVASKCQLPNLLNQCIERVAYSTLDDNFLEKELAGDIYNDIKKYRRRMAAVDELDASILDAEHEKRVTDIHKALDSGNVDLVSMLLKQYGVTLDEALAIHYAATYCEPKVFRELLKLDQANVNMKNSGGYTPLHMACMRLEPDIIVALLNKGASVLEQTKDQRNALTICMRLTRHQKDVNIELKKGLETSKPYLCILPILEEIKRTLTDQVSLEEAIARLTPLRDDYFFMKLLDLEYRVTFAKLFFPSVAKLAMRIAEADSTEEFAGAKLKDIDLNEPSHLHWRFRERFDALTRTVDLGRRYFPSCSDVLDKFLTEESALALLGNSTPEEDQVRMQFYELRKEVRKAFDKDTASDVINSTGLATLELLYKRGMLNLGTNPSQADGAADSTNAHASLSGLSIQAPNVSTTSRQLESQSIDVTVDDDVGVGSKRKLKSIVWDKFKRVKIGDDCVAICMRCQKPLKACSKKNGTSRLHRHLTICQSR